MLCIPPPLTQAMGNVQIHEFLGKPLVGLTSLPPNFGPLNINSQSDPLRAITGRDRHWDSMKFEKMLLSLGKKGFVVGYNVLRVNICLVCVTSYRCFVLDCLDCCIH